MWNPCDERRTHLAHVATSRLVLPLVALVVVVAVRVLPLFLLGAPGGVDGRAQYRHEGADGRQHAYLGDYDSYLWVRHARNYLRQGTTCDAAIDGICRDTLAPAPVGRRMRYARSLHIAAIVALQRVADAVAPGWPLTATAFWVPVIIGALGVPPAFAIGRRIGGRFGAVAAAVLVGTHPVFLGRSIGADNDVWNVVLPVWMAWAAIEAMIARRAVGTVVYALVAAGFAALHAATWGGWMLTYVVVLLGLALYAVRTAIACKAAACRRSMLALVVLVIATGTFTTLTGSKERDLDVPPQFVAPLVALHAAPPTTATIFPNALRTVAEAQRAALPESVRELGGWAYVLLGWLGIVILWVPRRGGAARTAAAAVLTPWLVIAHLLTSGAERFALLAVPPLAFGVAAALGGAHATAGRVVCRALGGRSGVARVVATAGMVAVLGIFLRSGVSTARGYLPQMNDDWWDTLVVVRRTTPPETIVDTWWDYGHWVKYVAERRVTVDGAGLGTHVPYWFARALLAPSERETLGLLRMLNCGSDATPEPEAAAGAYGRLRALGFDELDAHTIVIELARLDRDAGWALLRNRGLDPTAIDAVLASTHCTPPPALLVLGSRMVHFWGLLHLGSWDVGRAYAMQVARNRPEDEAIADLVRRLGLDPRAARTLWSEARARRTPAEVERFIAPADPLLSLRSFPCRETEGRLRWKCPLRGAPGGVRGFVYRADSPAESRLSLRADGASRSRQARPAHMVVAGSADVTEVAFPGASSDVPAVLLDLGRRQIALGPAYLLRSTFARLMFLDDRGLTGLRKVADRAGSGEHVKTYRVAVPN